MNAEQAMPVYDDGTAVRVLGLLTRDLCRESPPDPRGAADLVREWRTAAPRDRAGEGGSEGPSVDEAVGEGVGEGDLARAALEWLADGDPGVLEAVGAIDDAPASDVLAGGVSAGFGAVALVLLLLKTRAVIARDRDGRWRFRVSLGEIGDGPLRVLLDLLARMVAA